ncbi:MAG: DNA translocase FtsK 4TM domain-containing protein, partial [bacterium]
MVGLFMLFSLIDYQPQYSSYHRLLHKNAPVTGNHLGSLGVSFAFYACRFFGVVAWLIPVYVLLFGSFMLGGLQYRLSVKKWLCFALSLLFVPTMFAFLQSIHCVNPGYNFYSAGKGGLLGCCFYRNVFANYLGPWGSALFLIPTALLLLCLSFSDLNGVVSKLWLVMRKLGGILRLLWSKCPKRFSMKSMGIFEHLRHLFSKISLPKFKKVSVVSEKAERSYVAREAFTEENKAEPVPTFRAIEPKREAKKDSGPIAENKSIQILASEKVEKSTDKVPAKQDGYKLPELNLLKDPPPV